MNNRILASVSLWVLILMGLGSASQGLANGPNEEVKGKTFLVKSSEGEYLGTARKVLVNPFGKADFIIVSLEQEENGTKEIIVPFNAISVEDEDSIILDLRKEVLAEAPVFNRPELNDPMFFEGVYRFYGMTPPWSEEKSDGEGDM